MIVLGIETSGLEGSLALLRDSDLLGEKRMNQPGRRHAQTLVSEAQELLSANGLNPRDVNLVAISRGPGSFTGLRVGMVFAKTFAYAADSRFTEIDTFEVIAMNLAEGIDRAFIIEDAQRDDLFVGEYVRTASNVWSLQSPIRIVSREEFVRNCSSTDFVTGPGVKKVEEEERQGMWLVDPEIYQPTARVVAELALRNSMMKNTESSAMNADFWKAVPFYLRQSAAEEKHAATHAAK